MIAGPEVGNERARLESLARELGVAPRVTFAGNVEHAELGRLYASADALLYLSEIESFGMPIIEAMGVGLPVLVNRIPGLTEVGADRPLWVESTATREQIARALTALLRNPDLRRRHIDAGRARAAPFTWSRAAELTARAIRRAAEEGLSSVTRRRRIGRRSA